MNLKNGKIFTSKFVGTGPSSYKKKNLPGRSLTKVEKYWIRDNCLNIYYYSYFVCRVGDIIGIAHSV